MKNAIIKFIVTGLSLFVADGLLDSVTLVDTKSLLLAAIVLGLANAIIRPILIILTLPITLVTLGLFLIAVNLFVYWLASYLVPGFELAGWNGLILGALVTWIVSWALEGILGVD